MSPPRKRHFYALSALLTIGYLFLGHLNYWPSGTSATALGFDFARPSATSGDEPHYLVLINSLLFDHDVRVDTDYARIGAGGYEAGAMYRGRPFGGHALLLDPRTGRSVLCSAPCTEQLAAQVGAPMSELIQVPAHPVAFPAFMAALAFPFRPSATQVEPLIGTFAIFIALAGVLLAYATARKSGLAPAHAAAAALLLGVASPWLPYLKSYFSEPSIGLFLLLGFLALRMGRPALAGLGVGVAMAMKPVFLLFGIAWIIERLWARRLRDALWLAGSIGGCGSALLAFNVSVLHTPMTSGNAAFYSATGFQSFVETLFDREHGVLPFAPWAAIPFFWGPLSVRPGATDREGQLTVEARRQLVLPLLFSLMAYSVIGWGPGYCYGPRYWVPLLPFLAILVIDFAIAGRRWRWFSVGLLAAVGAVIAVPAAGQYHWLFSKPPVAAILGPAR